MPVGVALPKLQATQDYGAEVVLAGSIFNEALKAAKEFVAQTGAVFIPPFDHPKVVMGQGTLGLDILDQVPDVDTVVVPIGGGGLIAGVDLDVQAQAQGSDPVGVVGMAWAARLLGVIAERRALLVAVDGLDGDIDVEDPL